jgi:hypothetical protein
VAFSHQCLAGGRLGCSPVLFWLALLLLVGCATGSGDSVLKDGASSAPSAPEATVSPPLHRAQPFSSREAGELSLVEQEVAVRVVEPSRWRRLPKRGEWSGRIHPESKSELWIRHVLARRTVELAECERDSRDSWSALRQSLSDEEFERTQASDHYQGRTRVVLDHLEGGRVEAFFVGTSRCLSVVYLSGEKPGFPERLQFFSQSIKNSVRLLSLDERRLGKRWEPY